MGTAVPSPDRGYTDQNEFMRDFSTVLDLLIYHYYSRHRWLGPDSELKNMLGLVVTREEFEHQLERATMASLADLLSPEEEQEVSLYLRLMVKRVEKTDVRLPLIELLIKEGFDEFALCCVSAAYACAIDKKYERIYAYLEDDMTSRAISIDLAVALFMPKGGDPQRYRRRFFEECIFSELFRGEEKEKGLLKLRESAVTYFSGIRAVDRDGFSYYDGEVDRPEAELLLQTEVARELDAVFAYGKPCDIFISGKRGSGKKLQVKHLMSRNKKACVFYEVSGDDWQDGAREASLYSALMDASLCLYHLDRRDDNEDPAALPDQMVKGLSSLRTGSGIRLFLSEEPLHMVSAHQSVRVDIPDISEGERLALFAKELSGYRLEEAHIPEQLASTFRFTPAQIRRATGEAIGLMEMEHKKSLSSHLIHECCYRQAVHKLGDLATRVPAAYTWDDVVLPDDRKRLMQQACQRVIFSNEVYGSWNFGKRISYGRGLSILFAGSPGTGKTMCSQVIANTLDMQMYKINLSQIVSKYIGETEKNLRAVFKEAVNANSILFFDECDALFSKRSEVKDSHDRNANVEVAYLLQQIEEFDGVCILATNLVGNIDEAFMRRLTYVVHFPFPDVEMREQIYRRMVTEQAPLSDDIDWRFLAEKFEVSGGYIKNIVLSAAFMAASEGSEITMAHMVRSAVNEMKKNEIIVVRERLAEYADLLEE